MVIKMVLKDAELDELWRGLGHYRGEIKEHLEVATETEATMFSMIPERLFREYRDLKANYEHEHEELRKLQVDYQKRISEIFELKRKYDKLNAEGASLQLKYFETNRALEELKKRWTGKK